MPAKAFDRALSAYNSGRLVEAETICRAIIAEEPKSFDALNLLGVVQAGLGEKEEALASYDLAIALWQGDAGVFSNRGIILTDLRRFDEALASFDHALTINPRFPAAHNNRGNTLKALERYDEALASFAQAIAIQPNYARAIYNRGAVLHSLDRLEEALACYDKAIAIKPDYAEAYDARGTALNRLNRFDDALTSFDTAIALKPDFAAAWIGRGCTFVKLGENNEAIECFERALKIDPQSFDAAFASCLAELHIIYDREADIVVQRERYERKLRAISQAVEAGTLKGRLATAIAIAQPFYLAYQGYNDRELQKLYGTLVCRIAAREYPCDFIAPPIARGERLRVGFVSGFFRNHSNWKIPLKGWMGQLDRRRFKVFGYYLGDERDGETDLAAQLCDRFVQRRLTIEGWRREILSDAPHVLIYPGLLMDDKSFLLAAQRLAPVQCNSWGHPETSGMPTLDYFLSSDLMEPPDASAQYTERLIRLPNLSAYYEPITADSISVSRGELGLRPDAVVFWCGQSFFKYLPQYDYLFAEIAKSSGNCQFLFLNYQGAKAITDAFRRRLEGAFANLGLRASDYCVFVDQFDFGRFIAVMRRCDVFLDSIGWSGCNSTLESLACDLPIVTMPGPFMRSRHTAAILQMMGITETIADSLEDYVAIAIRLANNSEERQARSRDVAQRKRQLYRDGACISALEEFLDQAARIVPDGSS